MIGRKPQENQYPWEIVSVHLALNKICGLVFINFYCLQVATTLLQTNKKQKWKLLSKSKSQISRHRFVYSLTIRLPQTGYSRRSHSILNFTLQFNTYGSSINKKSPFLSQTKLWTDITKMLDNEICTSTNPSKDILISQVKS